MENKETISKTQYYAHLEHCDNQFNAVIEVVNELVNHAAGHKLGPINDWVDKWANEKDWSINWYKILVEKGVDQTNLSISKIAALESSNASLKEEILELQRYKIDSDIRYTETLEEMSKEDQDLYNLGFTHGINDKVVTYDLAKQVNDIQSKLDESNRRVELLREALRKQYGFLSMLRDFHAATENEEDSANEIADIDRELDKITQTLAQTAPKQPNSAHSYTEGSDL